MAKIVNPIEVPNCAIVLKTAPARPCVFGVKASVMMRFAIVKITIQKTLLINLLREDS